MRSLIAGTNRESLLQEINNAFLQWPERERRIFTQAHYYGQSPEAIARSHQLNVEEVGLILQSCERRLHAALKNFRKGSGGESSLIQTRIPWSAGVSHNAA
jgi:DNA-directed RNA polymerase specialized sigma24 family protein